MRRGLSEEQRKALLFFLHEEIHSTASRIVKALSKGDVSLELLYPPGSTLTEQEHEVLLEIVKIPEVYSGLEKLTAEACWYPIFGLLQVVDGDWEPGYAHWKGISLLDRDSSDDKSELSDGFLETFDEWAVQCVGVKN